MKKLFIASALFAFYSCGDSADKTSEAKPELPVIMETKKKQTTADITMQKWMQGKVWTTDEGMAPMRSMKLKADGECDFFNGPAGPWTIVNSELVLKRLTEWPVEKVDDKTFRLYVKPSDTWYVYKHTADL